MGSLTPGTNRRDYSSLRGPVDDTAAQAEVTVIKDHVLTGRDRALRLVESDVNATIAQHLDAAGLIGLAVAHLGGAIEALCRRLARNPRQLRAPGLAPLHGWMIMALHDNEHIASEVLVGDVPGRLARIVAAADAQALTLAQRVVHE